MEVRGPFTASNRGSESDGSVMLEVWHGWIETAATSRRF